MTETNLRPENKSNSNVDGERDLLHFLRLASAQIRHRIENPGEGGIDPKLLLRLRTLQELIKEQIPYENSRHTAGASGGHLSDVADF